VANALVAGTVYTNAQPNITSVGTLTSLGVTGNITGNNITAANVLTVNSGNAATAIVNGAGTAQGNIGSTSSYFKQIFE
jgi:hypothetical protein